jgi:uncharacterized membrane protein
MQMNQRPRSSRGILHWHDTLDALSIFDLQIFGSAAGSATRVSVARTALCGDLGTVGSSCAFAQFVNNRGRVAGFSYTDSLVNPIAGVGTTHPLLWKKGLTIDLGTSGALYQVTTCSTDSTIALR